jgi:CHASE3 domain sensor protein
MLGRLWHRYSRPLVGVGAVVFLVSNVFVVWLAQFHLNALREPYANTEKMRDAAGSLLVGLLNAEVGARGYLVTGNEVYLGSYYTGVALAGVQMQAFSLMPPDEAQLAIVTQVKVMTIRQLDELAGLVKLRRERGREAAVLQFQTGADKSGLDALKSFIERAVADLSNSIAVLQRMSQDYQTISTYCVLFAAFWLYLIIVLAARELRDEV